MPNSVDIINGWVVFVPGLDSLVAGSVHSILVGIIQHNRLLVTKHDTAVDNSGSYWMIHCGCNNGYIIVAGTLMIGAATDIYIGGIIRLDSLILLPDQLLCLGMKHPALIFRTCTLIKSFMFHFFYCVTVGQRSVCKWDTICITRSRRAKCFNTNDSYIIPHAPCCDLYKDYNLFLC